MNFRVQLQPSRRDEALTRLLRATCAISVALALLSPLQGRAQTPPLKCAQLLSSDQVKTIVGAGMEANAPKQHEAGESECVWRRGTGANAVSLSFRFFDRQAINSNPVTRTPDGYFEMLVKAGEEVGDKKREAIAGVPRAALIQASPQILLVVQRSDGVARVVLTNFTRPQAIALAKVVATP